MSNIKNMNRVLDKEGKVIATFVDLPNGYFYKGKFYRSEKALFNVLVKEGIAVKRYYYNGTYEFRDIIFGSLEEIYENYPSEFEDLSLGQFKRNYKDFGIIHNSTPRAGYWLADDTFSTLYWDLEEVILEFDWDVSNYRIIGDDEDIQEAYCETLSNEEIIVYCKKTIKERIAILEKWQGGLLNNEK